ncbi:uncharacterized protein LOC143910692 [Arctopsyche grandis]|uniref:uncharacterized protein LOC143910692 n=1 Tax=Arctopsyche grandis TaxID=121162 RepID=UPI00406D6F8F
MSSLLDETPVYTLGCPLNSFFKIFVYFFLPPLLSFIIYLTLIAADLGIACCYIVEDNPRWATVTIILMFLPSIVGSMFTLATPERWPSDEPFDKKNMRFLALNLWHVFAFPFAAIYRYAHQVFWSIEAICANCVNDSERTENSLRILMKPNSLELYFFLQSYLHSAPQILFQFYLLLSTTYANLELASLQILSIVMSLMRMATITMLYQRFERRKTLGIHYPWASKQSILISGRASNVNSTIRRISEMLPYERVQTFSVRQFYAERVSNNPDDDEVFEEPLYVNLPNNVNNETQRDGVSSTHADEILPYSINIRSEASSSVQKFSSSSSIYEEPIAYQDETKLKRVVSIVENPDVVMRRTSRIEQVKRSYKIEDMSQHITPPSTPAPRPGSMAFIKGKFMTNAESIVDRIPKRRHYDDIDLPVRVRRSAIKGVDQEDGVSKMIAFVAWFLFIGARMLVLSSFSSFYIMECLYICIVHYVLVTSLLLWNSWYENVHRKVFYLFLGYVYTFCLIEFKMKFKKVRLWYGGFFSVITIENFILTAIWYATGNFNNWWYTYVVIVITGASTLSYVCFIIYFLILKPKPITLYPMNSSFSDFLQRPASA